MSTSIGVSSLIVDRWCSLLKMLMGDDPVWDSRRLGRQRLGAYERKGERNVGSFARWDGG